MKVFVTGIAGFLGCHLASQCLEQGWMVGGNDNLKTGSLDNVPQAAEFNRVDCTAREHMLKAVAGYDILYHTAALPYEGLSVFSPAQIARSVYQGTVSTVAAAVEAGVDRIIFLSSMSRYGNQQPPFTETMPPRPVDPYGLAKVGAERMTRLLGEIHGFEWVIVVPHNIIGPRQNFRDPYRNVAAIFINRMLRGMDPVIYGDGSQVRCFSYVGDVVRSLVNAGTADNVCGEVINVGPDRGEVSIRELAEILADIMDIEIDPIFEESRPREVRTALCSADKARRLLDYKTETALREALEEMVEWIRAEGPKEFCYDALDIEINSSRVPIPWKEESI